MDVSVRELKSYLSQYLRRARAGEVITVTLRGRRVARLVAEPVTQAVDPDTAAIAQLRAQPWLTPARKQGTPKGADRLSVVSPGTSDDIMRWVRGG